ncbi:putative transcription factor MADS-type1 family [Helianthus annuus]|uniref:Transcription factor MADS-type1 family n=1 Tax=Helianthus annuus TaxID=4232 RepID=A0A9K3NKQ9_HELAN|nr:putative transcription factor MADS-type1 family [Helianthus annuus]KAJ0567862.1 putative transcription factor MADS-type1 family [Helianthus annuus]KAJ0574308.1 putative transcription factor MADS-type1 family [Helianthus annuus]KAJ0738644.1 putative transcription factor MADS-type1 family [Helianthus annuus]KAJ0912815.1 putative transcription factor MADS-type1 family [Helianthus annuus]
MLPRKSKGLQKIQMARVEKASDLLVTFSKRRHGLFTNASELSILCGVEIATIFFSGGIKVFSFSHPSVENLFNFILFQQQEFKRVLCDFSNIILQLILVTH